jgi:hypothetical protein
MATPLPFALLFARAALHDEGKACEAPPPD